MEMDEKKIEAKIKIEFIKDVNLDGSIIYMTHANDKYIAGSLSSNKEEAEKKYEDIVENYHKAKKEILKSIEI